MSGPAQVKLVRTCVASLCNSHSFGPMVAAEAQERDFYQARKASGLRVRRAGVQLDDSQDAISKNFTAIADFMHVVCYLYVTAWAAGGTAEEQWSRYLAWLRSCWQGRVAEVIGEVEGGSKAGGTAGGEELAASDPRRLVAETLSYLRNNQERMAYFRVTARRGCR